MSVFLSKTMTMARAAELVEELGFLGICDLVHCLALQTDSMMEMISPRAIVKIKKRPRAKKVKG